MISEVGTRPYGQYVHNMLFLTYAFENELVTIILKTVESGRQEKENQLFSKS